MMQQTILLFGSFEQVLQFAGNANIWNAEVKNRLYNNLPQLSILVS